MMSFSMIADGVVEAGARAEIEHIEPRVPTAAEHAYMKDRGELAYGLGFRIPTIGDYVPVGWELIRTHFVDKTGEGYSNEPALTWSRFAKVIGNSPTTDGWATVEEGQFQIYVGQFRRVPLRGR